MRTVDFTRPCPTPSDPERRAALTRHLNARLLDLDPGGPEVLLCDPDSGLIHFCLPDLSPHRAAAALSTKYQIHTIPMFDHIELYLNESIPFEDLDHVWGCLLQLLAEKEEFL